MFRRMQVCIKEEKITSFKDAELELNDSDSE